MSDSPREPASPLVPLAWGFVALFPLPLVAMPFAETELERKLEYVMAAVLLVAAAVLFALDVGRRRRQRPAERDPDLEEDEA